MAGDLPSTRRTMAGEGDILVCTLGMFILDDIYPREDQCPKLNVIGGAGTYSALGARLFCPSEEAKRVGWIVDAGTDFPEDVMKTINQWNTGALIRERNALTTRGLNTYTEDEHRAFSYLTEKKRITAEDLTPHLLRSRSFHLICSASRCMSLVSQILGLRGSDTSRTLMIWEPVPDLCTAAELDAIRDAISQVDVISPNHEELATLFAARHPQGGISKTMIEEQASQLLEFGIGHDGKGAVIVRSGKEGAYAATRMESFWIPAYHSDQRKVIDPTGGGNGFLGGLALGMAQQKPLRVAVEMATIAASFCIEQVGPPVLELGGSEERWNGVVVQQRFRQFQLRQSSRHI